MSRASRTQATQKRAYTNRARWTLNQWLELAWDQGLTLPSEGFFVSLYPSDVPPLPPHAETPPLSPKAFKALVYLKGWMLKDLAEHWRMRPDSLSRVIRTPQRSRLYDEALLGLPIRRQGAALSRFPKIKQVLISIVSE